MEEKVCSINIKPGDLGENLTTAGIANKDFSPGKTYRVG